MFRSIYPFMSKRKKFAPFGDPSKNKNLKIKQLFFSSVLEHLHIYVQKRLNCSFWEPPYIYIYIYKFFFSMFWSITHVCPKKNWIAPFGSHPKRKKKKKKKKKKLKRNFFYFTLYLEKF